MKKSFILLVAFVAMVFASCSKDDDDDPSNEVGSITMTTFNDRVQFYFYTEQNEVFTIDWGDDIIEEYRTVKKEKDDLVEYTIDAIHSFTQTRGHTIKVTGKLTGLDCRENELTSLDASKCRSLQELSCPYNILTSLNVNKCAALTYLWCGGNELTALDVSKCTALTGLICDGNELTSLDVSKCTALTGLDCGYNQLTSLDVSKCTALTGLECNDNELTSLDVSKCMALTRLWCGGNKLTSLDISKCTALTRLKCDDNSFSSDALNKIFNDLPKGKTWEEYNHEYQSTIYINGNPGTETCNKSIFENKGWKLSIY